MAKPRKTPSKPRKTASRTAGPARKTAAPKSSRNGQNTEPRKAASRAAGPARKTAASPKSSRNGQNDGAKELAARRAAQAKLEAAGFGEIVSVLMRSPHYKHYSLADLEWLIVPPLLAKQFTLAEARNKDSGVPAPVGVALWARVSDEVDQKLSSDLDHPMRLRPDEWTSGDHLWLIDAVGAPEAVKVMVSRLGEAVFKDRPYKMRARGRDGRIAIQTVDASARAAG